MKNLEVLFFLPAHYTDACANLVVFCMFNLYMYDTKWPRFAVAELLVMAE